MIKRIKDDFLTFLSKLFWLVIIIFIIANILFYHFFSWFWYLFIFVFWNIIVFYLTAILITIIWKRYFVKKTQEVVNEIQEEINLEPELDVQEAKIIEK